MLRTCFRTGVMINQAARCFDSQQDVVFELYARVTYSNRASLERRQHFQFLDLFKDLRPCPSGALVNWRVGSQLDRQSSAFLSMSNGPKLCRCICKPIKDPIIPNGLYFAILSISETSWKQIEWRKMVVCGSSDEKSWRDET